jgi:hypothetical protein
VKFKGKGITVILLTISIHGVFFSVIPGPLFTHKTGVAFWQLCLLSTKSILPVSGLQHADAIEAADKVLFQVFDLSERCIAKLSI